MTRIVARTHLTATRLPDSAHSRRRRERGATSAEYAIIIAGIAIVVIVAVILLGSSTLELFNRAATSVPST